MKPNRQRWGWIPSSHGVACLAGFLWFFLATGRLDADVTLLEVQTNERIVEVVERVRDRGYRIAYSASVLPRRFRVLEKATPQAPIQLLEAVLQPHGLRIQPVGELWVVVRQAPPEVTPTFALFDVVSSETGLPIDNIRLALGNDARIERLGVARFRASTDGESELRVSVSADGFDSLETLLELSEAPDQLQTLSLAPERPGLPEVTVSASRYEILREVLGSPFLIDQRSIMQLPDVGDDPIRAVHRLPGAAANGLSAKVHVRGGEQNDVAIVLNGQPLLDPFHIRDYQNVFSAIDVRAIDGIEVFTGGFPANYGDRMGGLILIDTLDVANPRYTELGLSVFNTSILSAGRVAEDQAGWLVTARRSNLDLVLNEELGRPRYTDFLGEIDFRPLGNTTISVNALVANDDVLVVTESDPDEREASFNDTRNRQFWVSWEQRWTKRLSSSTTLSASSFRSLREGSINDPEKLIANVDDTREVDLFGVRQDWAWRATTKHSLAWGTEWQRVEAEYRYRGSTQYLGFAETFSGLPDRIDRQTDRRADGDAYGLFLSHQWQVTPRFVLEAGLRWDKQGYVDLSDDTQVSPRINLMFSPTNKTDLRASWGRYYQPQSIQELQVEDGVVRFFPAQRADHLIFGLEHDFGEGLSLRAEVYRKNMSSLRPRYENLFDPLALIPEFAPDRIRIAPDAARSEGLELSIGYQRPSGLNLWASYVLSKVDDDIDGQEVPRSWDQRHSLQAGIGWQYGRWDFGLAGSYHSGWPRTEVFLDQDAPEPTTVFGPRNGSRYPNYVNFDLRIAYEQEVRKGTLSLFAEVSNVLDRKNPCCIDFDLSDTDSGLVVLDRDNDYWLPRLFAIGALWKF